MNRERILREFRLASCALALALPLLSVHAGAWGENYDEALAGPTPLQDPLVFADGRKVTTAEDWRMRRAEIVDLFAREMYGQPPPRPECVETELVDEKVSVSGFAIRRRYRMWFRRDRSGPCVNWICFLPRHAAKPAPVILFLNYRGNFELVGDADIPVGDFYVPYAKGNRPNPEKRGVQQDPEYSSAFPIGMILARGYAVMSACYAEVSPDPAWQDVKENATAYQEKLAYTGVFDLWPARDASRTDNTTSIGAWAWALSRGLDLAVRQPEIDTRKSVVTGCSRLAKAALLAAVWDERFAVCVPVQTGGGGCPLAKHYYGENVRILTKAFPHWFCKAYAKYADKEASLPFDPHLLLACIAPRGLLVEGFDDPWYDTKGEYMAVRAASPVWSFLGKGGMPDVPWPKPYETQAIGHDLGYVHRTEKHGISPYDWRWMLDFADGIFIRKDAE